MSKKTNRTGPIPIYIEWRDPTSDDGWKPINEIKTVLPHTIQTLGYMTHQTKDVVVVSLNIDMNEDTGEGGNASCSIIIPRSLISHMQKLKVLPICRPKLLKK